MGKGEKIVWYKNPISYLWIVAGLFLLTVIAVPQYLYFSHFNGKFAEKAEDWGQYGDFIGGLSNPLLSAISIGVLVYLTITVHNNEKKRHEDAISLETERNNAALEVQKAIALNGFRHDALKSFRETLDKFEGRPTSYKEMASNYDKLEEYLANFNKYNGYLFSLHPRHDEIFDSLTTPCGDIKNQAIKLIDSKTDPSIFLKNHTIEGLTPEEKKNQKLVH